MATAFTAIVLLLILPASEVSGLYEWDHRYSLTGTLKREVHLGPPGYGETPKHDIKETIAVLDLPASIHVTGDALGGAYSASMQSIQLVLPESHADFQDGTCVDVTGALFPAHTGHHRRRVVMDVESITDTAEDQCDASALRTISDDGLGAWPPEPGDPLCYVRIHRTWADRPKDWMTRIIGATVETVNKNSGAYRLGGGSEDEPGYAVVAVFAPCEPAQALALRLYRDMAKGHTDLFGPSGITDYDIGSNDLCPAVYRPEEKGEFPTDLSQIDFDNCTP